MNLKEGDLVVVVGKLSNKVRERSKDGLVIGTYIGKISDDRVVVLLDDGEIFIGSSYEIIEEDEQK